jgi:hypothetical protein
MPQTVANLAWLGLSPATQAITVCHAAAGAHPVNINTAPPEVLRPGLGWSWRKRKQCSRALTSRHHAGGCRTTWPTRWCVLMPPSMRWLHAFAVTGQLRGATLQERSVLQRDGLDVKP